MRYWSVLLAAAFAFTLGGFLYAPLDADWWLPNYATTNRGALAKIEAASAELAKAADLQSALADEVGRLGPDGDGDKIAQLVTRSGAIRKQLEGPRETLKGLVAETFLPEQTRPALDAVVATIAANESAETALSASKPAESLGPLGDAAKALQTANAGLSRGLEEPDSSVSTIGRGVDHLFVLILGITGAVFVLTQLALIYVVWRYEAKPGRPALYSHGSQRLEVIWTLVPAVILVFLAFYQMDTWAEIKFPSRLPEASALAEVSARQFQWRVRYPGPDGQFETPDDLIAVNDLHFVKGEPTWIRLKTEDVIHSFDMPQLRVKQDALPGLTIPVRFDADKAGRYELACAELCGWGHYKMRATVVAHESRSDFEDWMKAAYAEQDRDMPPPAAPIATAAAGEAVR